jgi:hypothetical protein
MGDIGRGGHDKSMISFPTCVEYHPPISPTYWVAELHAMLDSPIVWFCAAAGLTFAILSWRLSEDSQRAPGPKGWPFIGNLLEIPAKSPGPFVYFEQLAKRHGESFG